MPFDPFRDFKERGYLQNFAGKKDPIQVKELEDIAFRINLSQALDRLSNTKSLSYQDILDTHKTLFGEVYPWAGKDRLETAPNIAISKAGYEGMFANPTEIRRVVTYALRLAQEPTYMRENPGEILGLLAHAHPFLEGNGRVIMSVHTELTHRAGMSIDWAKTDKKEYLAALTNEIYYPAEKHLNRYLRQFIRSKIERSTHSTVLEELLNYKAPPPLIEPEITQKKQLSAKEIIAQPRKKQDRISNHQSSNREHDS